jgi:putative component of membrane protein insertase Oxa1/YidC/SpoIIIJ protein YidD
MKYLFILFIRFYWIAIRPFYHSTCLFKTSCSREVYNSLKLYGFIKGIRVLKYRMKYCKPGYSFYYSELKKQYILEFHDGHYLEEKDISPEILK